MATQFATRLALIAFATVVIRGAIEQAIFYETLSTALTTGALFFGLGIVVGELSRRIAEEIAVKDFQQSIEQQQPNEGSSNITSSPTS